MNQHYIVKAATGADGNAQVLSVFFYSTHIKQQGNLHISNYIYILCTITPLLVCLSNRTGSTFLFFPWCMCYKIHYCANDNNQMGSIARHQHGCYLSWAGCVFWQMARFCEFCHGKVQQLASHVQGCGPSAVSVLDLWVQSSSLTASKHRQERARSSQIWKNTHTHMHTGGCKSEKNTGEFKDPMGEMDSSSPSLRRPIAHRRADDDFDVSFSWTHLRFEL